MTETLGSILRIGAPQSLSPKVTLSSSKVILTPTKPYFLIVPFLMKLWESNTFKWHAHFYNSRPEGGQGQRVMTLLLSGLHSNKEILK